MAMFILVSGAREKDAKRVRHISIFVEIMLVRGLEISTKEKANYTAVKNEQDVVR